MCICEKSANKNTLTYVEGVHNFKNALHEYNLQIVLFIYEQGGKQTERKGPFGGRVMNEGHEVWVRIEGEAEGKGFDLEIHVVPGR